MVTVISFQLSGEQSDEQNFVFLQILQPMTAQLGNFDYCSVLGLVEKCT